MRAGFVALLLGTACAGEARAQAPDTGFCAQLHHLLVAAAERPAFTALGRRGAARAARDLGFETCRVTTDLYGNRLDCNRTTRPGEGAATARRIARCVPEAIGMSEAKGSRLYRFRLGFLAFYVADGPPRTRFSLFAMPIERR